MYPDGQLSELAVHRLALRQRITLRRRLCVVAATRAAEPFHKLDHLIERWHQISPIAKIAAVPLAVVLKRTVFRRAKVLGTLLRWGPLAFKVFRGMNATR